MTRQRRFYGLLIFTAGCLLAAAGCAVQEDSSPDTHAHGSSGGHSHGGGAAVTQWTDAVEVFFEHPAMVAGREGEPWAIHVTILDGYRPVTDGQLTLRFNGPEGRTETFTAETPSRPGIFTPAPSLPAAGTYQLVMEISGPQISERVEVGDMQVYRPDEHLPHVEESVGGAITFLKEEQWEVPFAVAEAREQQMYSSLQVHGKLVPAAGKLAHASAPVSGLVRVEENRRAPAPGDRVEEGDALAVLSPVGGENSFAAQRAKVEGLRQEVARLERLYAAEAVPEKRLIDARRQLEVAQSALESMNGDNQSGYDYTVRAPISGIIDQRNLTIGSRVEAGETLFTLVDSREIWLRLNVPAAQASQLSSVRAAAFTAERDTAVYRTDRVVSVGSVVDPETRTVPVTFAVDNPVGALKIGMLVDAHLLTGDAVGGLAIPTSAVRMEEGLPVAYVQIGGESFERRRLTLGPSNGRWTLVRQGIRSGEHVVTDGSYQVKLASLNTGSIGHGHSH